MDFQEAYDATNPDATAYGLPADASEEDVNKRRTQAAQALLAGVAANEAYWNSRSPLEALAARAQGHASIGVPPDQQDAASVESGAQAPAIETTATTAPAPPATPENATSAVATLRAQLESAGIAPEA